MGRNEVINPNTQPTKEARYYLSNLDFNYLAAKEIANHTRGPLEVEGRLHWHPNVTFHEDARHAHKNFSVRT